MFRCTSRYSSTRGKSSDGARSRPRDLSGLRCAHERAAAAAFSTPSIASETIRWQKRLECRLFAGSSPAMAMRDGRGLDRAVEACHVVEHPASRLDRVIDIALPHRCAEKPMMARCHQDA